MPPLRLYEAPFASSGTGLHPQICPCTRHEASPIASSAASLILYESTVSLKSHKSFQTNSISDSIESVLADPLNDQEFFYFSERWIVLAVIRDPTGDYGTNTGKRCQLSQCGLIDIYSLGGWHKRFAALFDWGSLCRQRYSMEW
jgi:hypothetical protein